MCKINSMLNNYVQCLKIEYVIKIFDRFACHRGVNFSVAKLYFILAKYQIYILYIFSGKYFENTFPRIKLSKKVEKYLILFSILKYLKLSAVY